MTEKTSHFLKLNAGHTKGQRDWEPRTLAANPSLVRPWKRRRRGAKSPFRCVLSCVFSLWSSMIQTSFPFAFDNWCAHMAQVEPCCICKRALFGHRPKRRPLGGAAQVFMLIPVFTSEDCVGGGVEKNERERIKYVEKCATKHETNE